MIDKLLKRLTALHKMDELIIDRIKDVTRFSTYPKKTFLLRDGQVCDKACMVVSGLARAYYINEDKDITSRFMDEGFIITSWISYYHQKPGDEFIEAIEDTTLACITYTDIQRLYKDYPEFNIVGRKQTEYSLYTAEMRTRMLRKHTAEEKYAFFQEQHPDLINRARQLGYKDVDEYARIMGYDKEKSEAVFKEKAAVIEKHKEPERKPETPMLGGGKDFSGQGNDKLGGFGTPPSGKTEKSGFTVLTFTGRSNTTEVVVKAGKVALKNGDEWSTSEEMAEDTGGEGGGFNAARMTARRAETTKLPSAEATELLKDRHFSVEVSQIVRKMKSTRQIECIELMVAANNLTVAYARALLVATPPDMLIDKKSPKKTAGISQEQMARMQREMSNLQGQYKLVEQTYGEDVLNLVLAKGYVTKLLGNKRVVKYLEQHQQDIMEQFVSLSETTSLEH